VKQDRYKGLTPVTPTAFSRTFARLLADRGRSTGVTMAAGSLVLAAWCWWATHAEVALYELTTSARIELDASTYPVQSPLLGRIRPGQSATLRLEGFPWAEFGSVSAAVARVAQEIRDESVRVELAIDSRSTFRGTLQHGMPGSLEVVVERLTPLALVLRTAGQWLTARR
jgi:hypothetical protein